MILTCKLLPCRHPGSQQTPCGVIVSDVLGTLRLCLGLMRPSGLDPLPCVVDAIQDPLNVNPVLRWGHSFHPWPLMDTNILALPVGSASSSAP